MEYVQFGTTEFKVSHLGAGLHEHVGRLWAGG